LNTTAREVIAAYLRHAKAANLHSPVARADRERTFRAFCGRFGDLPVEDLRAWMLSEWIEAHETWRVDSTRRAIASHVKAAFEWATLQERIPRNPFRAVRYGYGERRPDMPAESLEQFAALASKAFERALRWLRLTGCRISELAGALWDDMDMAKGVWTIHKHKSRKKTKRPKLVPLVPEAVALLRELLAMKDRRAKTGPRGQPIDYDDPAVAAHIFLNSRGRPWQTDALGRYLSKLKERYGIEERASLHGVRHAAATAMIAGGAPIKLVAEVLGHTSTKMCEETYWHPTEEHTGALRDALAKGLTGHPPSTAVTKDAPQTIDLNIVQQLLGEVVRLKAEVAELRGGQNKAG
jgi:integrase